MMPRLRNSFNWGSINTSNRVSKSSFKSYIEDPKEEKQLETTTTTHQNKADHNNLTEGGNSSNSKLLSKHGTGQDNDNDSDEIWISALSGLDDSIEQNIITDHFSSPNITASSHRTDSLESLDVLDAGTRFIVSVPFKRLTMSPSRSRDSYQVSRESLDVSVLSAATTKSASSMVASGFELRSKESTLGKPVEGVIRYHLNSKRTKGTIGQFCLTTVRLRFSTYQHSTFGNDSLQSSDLGCQAPPFDFHAFSEENHEVLEEDIDLINLYAVRVDPAPTGVSKHLLLTIYCNDFRCIEYQVKNNDDVKMFLDNLERLIVDSPLSVSSSNLASAPPTKISEKPCLWYYLSTEYSYRFPQDWNRLENHWLEGKTSLRITHCNDDFQLCNSLPPSFITLKYHLVDATIVKKISPQLKGQRVPVVCYCSKSNSTKFDFNLLIRSITLTEDVTNIFHSALSRLRIIDVNEQLPPMALVMAAYSKLRDASSAGNNGKHFLCQVGKWLKLVSKVLAVVNDLTKVLEQSSLLLIEDTDRHWNPLLSSLIQLLIDPYRRTIRGFESLLSKEWIYLCGASSKPNQVLFTLFLDCVWQLKMQNMKEFEFSSLYLIRLFDLLYIPVTSYLQSQDVNESYGDTNVRSANFDTELTLTLSLRQLSLQQLMFMYNPVYVSTERKLRLSYEILMLEFWRPLYLRWHQLTKHIDYYNQFNPLEFIYFNSLLVSLFKYNVKTVVKISDHETVL